MKLQFIFIFTAVLLICNYSNSGAQMVSMTRANSGFTIGASAAGTGLTGNYSAGFYRNVNKNTIALEVTLPASTKYISGGQISFYHDILKSSDSYTRILGLQFFLSAGYNHQTQLSKSSERVLEKLAPEYKDASQIRYKTVDAYSGIAVTAKLSDKIMLFTNIGAGYFHTLETSSPSVIPVDFACYKSDADISLMSKAGVRIKIKG